MLNSKRRDINRKHNTSRSQILNWINNTLLLNITEIGQLGTGAVYCQLLDSLYPDRVPLHKVNWKAKQQYQIVSNYKTLQAAFDHLGIEKQLDVQRLSQCKTAENWEVIQWFKHFIDSQGGPNSQYNPIAKRKNVRIDLEMILSNFNKYPGRDKQNKDKNLFSQSKSYIPDLKIKPNTCRSISSSHMPSSEKLDCSKTYSISNYTTIRTVFSLADVPFIPEVDEYL